MYHYDDYDDYYDDSDYDMRTYNQKVRDDNTWQKDNGLLEFDGEPFLQWCEECKRVVTVREVEGSTVFDRYSYIYCNFCGVGEDQLRAPTNEELESYDPNTPPDNCMDCKIKAKDVPDPRNFRLYRIPRLDMWVCFECFLRVENIQTSGPISPEEELKRAALDHSGRP